jgi:hypothetical protein
MSLSLDTNLGPPEFWYKIADWFLTQTYGTGLIKQIANVSHTILWQTVKT